MRKASLFIIFAWIGFSSCTFAPDEEYLKVIDPTLPNVSIDLNEYAGEDTIKLYQATDFNFKISADRGYVNSTRVTLGNTVLLEGTAGSGSFQIRDESLRTGIFTLEIKYTGSTGTGSLVDKLGGEVLEAWRKWIVKIDVDPPPTPQMKLSEQDGYLKVSWEPYTKANFVKYDLVVNSTGFNKIISITDPFQNFFIDSSFIYGYATYHLTTTNLAHSTSATKSQNHSQEFNLVYRATDSTVLLSWKSTRYFSAFKEFEVLENDQIRQTITNATDTTLDLKLQDVIWGGASWIDFKVKRSYDGYSVYSQRIYIQDPLQLPRLQQATTMTYNLSTLSIWGSTSSGFCRYTDDIQPFECKSLTASYSLPQYGNLVHYGSDRYIVQLNMQTSTADQQQITTSNLFSWHGVISGGANGIVTYAYIDNTYSWDRRYHRVIQDVSSGAILREDEYEYDPKVYYYHNYTISPAGNYAFFPGSTIYKIENNSLVFHFGSNFSLGAFRVFRPDNPDEAFFSNGSGINIVNLATQTIVQTIAAPESGYDFKNYDPATKSILFTKTGSRKLHIVNIDSGTLTSVEAIGDSFKLVKGILFSGDGTYLKVIL